MDNLSQGKRVMIATALAIVFFIVWGKFFSPEPPNAPNSNLTTQAAQIDPNAAPRSAGGAPNAAGGENLGAGANSAISGAGGANANAAPLTPAQRAQNAAKNALSTIETGVFKATFDSLGRVSSWILLDEKFKDENGEQLNLITAAPLPLEVRFSNPALNAAAFATPYTLVKNSVGAGGGELVLAQDLGEVRLTKTLDFEPSGAYRLKIAVTNAAGTPAGAEFFVTTGHRPDVLADAYAFHGTRIKTHDEKFENIDDGDLDIEESFRGATFVSNTDRYYTTLLYSAGGLDLTLQPQTRHGAQTQIPFIRAGGEFSALGFIGAKNYDQLVAIDPALKDVVEYGFFTFIAKYMFAFVSWIFGWVGNWGWAIVVMTLIMRLVLFPLTYRSMVSMGKMKDLAPKMQEIREKHKKDPAKMQAATMELYRKSGVNPVSGCLPILLQIPIFFAVYRVLLNSIELKGAEWAFWITDLAQKDPYFVLPILMGALMFLQQRLTPTTMRDKTQEMIFKFLPVVFTFFFLWFPAGLTLYWCVNNLCSVLQQLAVNKMLGAKRDAQIAAHKGGAGAKSDGGAKGGTKDAK